MKIYINKELSKFNSSIVLHGYGGHTIFAINIRGNITYITRCKEYYIDVLGSKIGKVKYSTDRMLYIIYHSIIKNIPINYILNYTNSTIVTPNKLENERINNLVLEEVAMNYSVSKHSYFPKNRDELYFLIIKLIEIRGNNCSLNDIDVSEITSMNAIFSYTVFNGDISKWNVSNVADMDYMFKCSKFNGDIGEWNTSKVNDMYDMFHYSPLEKNPPKWYKGK